MRFRLGLTIGFGAGYYLGAKAGRERYDELNRLLRRAKETELFETAAEKTKAVVDLGVERARDIVDRSDQADSDPTTVVVAPANGRTTTAGTTSTGLPNTGLVE